MLLTQWRDAYIVCRTRGSFVARAYYDRVTDVHGRRM